MSVVTMAAALHERAVEQPDRPAVTGTDGVWTRREADLATDLAAERLDALGVRPGSVVAFSGPNSARLLLLAFATWKAGGVPLHLHARKGTVELARLLTLAAPAAAVGFDGSVIDAVAAGGSTVPTTTLDHLFAPGPIVSRGETPPPPLRIGSSGGSTGPSKLIMVDVPAITNPDRPWHWGLRRDGTHVVPLDLTDGTGFVATVSALAAGCHQILMPEADPHRMLALIEQHRADWLALTHPLLTAVAKMPAAQREAYDVSSLRWVTQYSGAVATWVTQTWLDWLGEDRFAESYGATDGRGSTWITGTEWRERMGSVGRPRPGCEIAAFAPDGRRCEPGELGEVHIRDLTGHRNFRYLGRDHHAEPGAWETVGDSGWLDVDGYLFLADRTSDLIVTADGPMAPLPLEGALELDPDVRSAIVLGLPGEGEDVVHAIVDTAGRTVPEARLRALLAERFPDLRPPDVVEFCDGPLRDNAGKAQRGRLRAERLAATRLP